MVNQRVNRLILEAVDNSACSEAVKKYIKEILDYERNYNYKSVSRFKAKYIEAADKQLEEGNRK